MKERFHLLQYQIFIIIIIVTITNIQSVRDMYIL